MERVRKMEKGDDLSVCSDEIVENLIIENRLLLDECEELMEREEEVRSGNLRESKLGETMTSLGDSFIETFYEASKSIPEKAKRLIPTYKAEKERHWTDTKISKETRQKTQGKAHTNRQDKKEAETTKERRPATRTKQKATNEEAAKEEKRKEGTRNHKTARIRTRFKQKNDRCIPNYPKNQSK